MGIEEATAVLMLTELQKEKEKNPRQKREYWVHSFLKDYSEKGLFYTTVKIIKLLCLPVVFRNAISIVLVLTRMTVKLQQQLNLFIIDVL